ncbi:hypothetical protein Ptr902_07809 [Pyrenophora tritici-repentis]|nr:hypothetical protein Ptr902_07809 [Pyrenophora tritici-repentis]
MMSSSLSINVNATLSISKKDDFISVTQLQDLYFCENDKELPGSRLVVDLWAND